MKRFADRNRCPRLCVQVSLAVLVAFLVAACSPRAGTWNSPYPVDDAHANTLYSSFSERPKHLDPVRAYSSNEYTFIAQIYEPPLQYHFLKRPYTLVPLTATRVPEPSYYDSEGLPLSPDAAVGRIATSVYEIRIQPGIQYQPHPAFARDSDKRFLYHNLDSRDLANINVLDDFERRGTRELVAADYVYHIKRMAHPKLHSPISGLMQEYILGLREYHDALAEVYATLTDERDQPSYLDLRQHPLAGVEVVDRYTYRIRIRGKYPQFLYWLAMPFFAPMPWEADRFHAQPGMQEKNLTLDWYPVGTGPYMLTENNPNRRMVLERNPYHHGERYPSEGESEDLAAGLLMDAGKPLPFIDKAVYNLEKENIPYWNKFLQGYYDASGISSDSFDQAVQFTVQGDARLTDDMREKGIRLVTAVSTTIFYMGFNMLDPVVGGSSERARKLRQAISIAVDYEEFISIFMNGRGVPAHGPIPPGIFGQRDGPSGMNDIVYDWVGGKARRKDIAEARRLLAEAGYPNGRDRASGAPLVLYFDTTATGPDDKARLDWMRKQLAKLDIQLVIRSTDYNRFQGKMRKGTSQIFQWGWNADYPDPENFFFLLYGSNSKVEHGGENAANYQNPDFDRLFDRMKHMADSPDRQAIIDEMLAILRRDAPWIWGFHPLAFSLNHAWYHNLKPNLMANNTLKYQRLEPALRYQSRQEWNRPVLWPVVTMLAVLLLSIIPAVISYRRRERATAR